MATSVRWVPAVGVTRQGTDTGCRAGRTGAQLLFLPKHMSVSSQTDGNLGLINGC
jgi:hypothetical protein